MAQLYTNNAASTLAAGIGTSDTSLTLASGHGARFPSPTGGDYFKVTLTQPGATETSWEIVTCTSRAGDVLTVSRGEEGTIPASWGLGSKVELRFTAGAIWPLETSVSGNLSVAHLNNGDNAGVDTFWRGDGAWSLPPAAEAETLTGTTLASNVVNSSLTSVGTIGTGVWQGAPLAANFGGTGFTSYAVGDIPYASTTSALSKLADVATGSVLISGGVGVAPSWGKVGLTTHVSGILPPANGGTGVANNAASTITISGAFASTFTLTGTTTVTFPTTGTLATTAQLPAAANPSGTIGLAAVNGAAATFLRSDGAPALSQAIAPTWTGAHTFTANPTALPAAPFSTQVRMAGTDAGAGLGIMFDNFANEGIFGFRRSNGTAASPTALSNGNSMFSFRGFGHNGSSFVGSAGIIVGFNANENWTSSANGTNIIVTLTPNGVVSASRVAAFKFTTAAMDLMLDNQELRIGIGNDLRLYHNGTDSFVENDTGALNIKSGGDLLLSEGQVALQTVGKGISIKEGTNAKMGVATLVAGTVVVNNTSVTANSRIQLTAQSLGTVTAPSALAVSARTAGTSFTILASQLTDTSVVGWQITEPS